MRFRAIIQARLMSSRLPKKVLEPIGTKSILEHIASRLDAVAPLGVETLFAIAEGDAPELKEYLTEKKLAWTAGSDFNVLERFIKAANDLNDTDFVIRLTGDNPFPDISQLAKLITYLKNNSHDYAYTAELPLGMGSEVIRVNALRSIALRSKMLDVSEESPIRAHHQEHVTIFIRENPHLYDILPFRLDPAFSEEGAKTRVKGIRLTIDEQADLQVCRKVFSHFEKLGQPHFGALEIIQTAKNFPEMFQENLQVVQKSAQSVDHRTLMLPTQPAS